MSSQYLAVVDDYLHHQSQRYRTYVDLRRNLQAYADEERREAAKMIADPDRPLLPPPPAPCDLPSVSAHDVAPPSAPTTASS
ncbi:TAP transporter inhibitor ICP47 [Macacine alphaherpesvirus 1]|uniref:ICP47 protein n=1 Tax=Macacine alphaherpesvirus 2 TaxID=2845554 RepID=A0A1X9WF61_9ALPH|nr:TAP transporter inhibitor ICP47 [Macacine alphaherpesvirus 1]ARS01709.1 TAP transporter inhibitor ICP47 [Macacine alphaherpesvirus 2]